MVLKDAGEAKEGEADATVVVGPLDVVIAIPVGVSAEHENVAAMGVLGENTAWAGVVGVESLKTVFDSSMSLGLDDPGFKKSKYVNIRIILVLNAFNPIGFTHGGSNCVWCNSIMVRQTITSFTHITNNTRSFVY